MNILETILENKRIELVHSKNVLPIDRLKEMPGYKKKCYSLKKALDASIPAIIAEIKKASPSKGIICKEFNHRSIAREYTDAGAAAISVLTDKVFFQGDICFISDIRTDVSIPILRKDFIIDSYQLAEAKAFGADAVLLIAAALGKNQLRELYDEAYATGLESLVEVHNEKELESLDLSRVKIVGINNRNLEDFSVDLDISVRLAAMIPPGITIVSESGISMREDIEILLENGIQAVLVGEGLMRSANPGEALRAILTAGKNG